MRWTVPRDWVGETAFIICGGPSVAHVDLTRLRGQRVVAVNSSYQIYPDADCLVFTDIRWWGKYKPVFRGQIITITPKHKLYHKRILVLDRQRSSGLSNDPTRLTCWHTSLVTAINLVALRGVSRIGVLGLDGKDTDGRSWHHAPHPWKQSRQRYEFHGEALKELVAPLADMRVQVFNLNPHSAHVMFLFASLDDLLSARQEAAA